MANLTIKGYTPPTSIGYGTWDDITPSQGIIRVETERNIGIGDHATIILSDDADFTNFEEQRAIQIFLDGTTEPTNLIWEGMILNTNLGMHIPWPNLRTYEISCVGYEKYLLRRKISDTWIAQSLNTIFTAIAEECNANHRFPTYKRFKYDTSKLTNYEAVTYTETIDKTIQNGKLYNLLSELTQVLDGIDATTAYEYGFYLSYLEDANYIYLMPDQLYSSAAATTDFSSDANIYANTKQFKRNYEKIVNFCDVAGDLYQTKHYHDTKIADSISVTSDIFTFDAATAPSQRAYIAIEIQNDAAGYEQGSISIDGYDAVAGNPLSETIYFYAPFSKTTTIYSRERYADFLGTNAFDIRNMNGATVNVYECTHGIAGRSIHDYGMCNEIIQRMDLNTQNRVDDFAQQKVRMYHNSVHEISFRTKAYNTTDYLNKTIDVTDDFYDATKRYLVIQQKYIIPENYDVEQWLMAIYRNYDWE